MGWAIFGPMPEDDLRFGRLEQRLGLALDLQGSLAGITLDDVMSRFDVSRRTATRMLTAVRRGWPSVRMPMKKPSCT